MQAELPIALKPVVKAFDSLHVRYAIGGSVASSMYGVPRSTLDIDIVADIPIDKAQSLYDLLCHDYYIDEGALRKAVAQRSSFNVIHLQTVIKVDVFILKEATYDRQTLQRLQTETLADETGATDFNFVSPEDVILNKLLWYRAGNEIAERQWNDVLGVLKVQKEHLDMEYLKRWADELDVSDLLERAVRKPKNNRKKINL